MNIYKYREVKLFNSAYMVSEKKIFKKIRFLIVCNVTWKYL